MGTLILADYRGFLVVKFGTLGFRQGGSLSFQETLSRVGAVSVSRLDMLVRFAGQKRVHELFEKKREIRMEVPGEKDWQTNANTFVLPLVLRGSNLKRDDYRPYLRRRGVRLAVV